MGEQFIYPAQFMHGDVSVILKGTDAMMPGKLLRYDAGEPYTTIIQLDNGWVVTGAECHWCYVKKDEGDDNYGPETV